MDISIIEKYFDLTGRQRDLFRELYPLYVSWNARINLISRKDMPRFYERHVLHSLAIARFVDFAPGTRILDVGTGGGFPGIPLAIMFPEVSFCLIDSIGKKIRAVDDVARSLELTNVCTRQVRAEKHRGKYHFIVSRAVTAMPRLTGWTRSLVLPGQTSGLRHGILALKGGDLTAELAGLPGVKEIPLSRFFREEFFRTKKIVYLPLG